MRSHALDVYSFWWSEVRLLIAATALFLGGLPPIYLLMPPTMYTMASFLLKLAWILSGLAAIQLLYRWYDTGQRLFGHKDPKDSLAFLLMVLTGLNLGFAGIFGLNLGMAILGGRIIYFIAGILYLFAAYRLWSSFWKNRNRLF